MAFGAPESQQCCRVSRPTAAANAEAARRGLTNVRFEVKLVSLGAGGPGLGAMWGKEKATEMLCETGFGRVRVETLPHDPMNYFYIATLSL